MTLQIRERRPEELGLAVEIRNEASLPDSPTTVDQARAYEAMLHPEDMRLHLLAFEGEPAGAGSVLHGPFAPPGRANITITVRPSHQRRGIAKMLYEHLLRFALEQGMEEVECGVREPYLPRVDRWLERETFREAYRMRESELRLDGLDLEAFAAHEARAIQEGIRLTVLTEQDSEDNRRRLWELTNLVARDIPYHVPQSEEPFDRFQEHLNSPLCLKDCLVIARDGDRPVGLSMLAEHGMQRALTWLTGVDPAYRGRGLATAIKVRAARLAKEQGYTAMRTFNHVNNPAMLAVNTRLGYVPLPESITFVKKLSS